MKIIYTTEEDFIKQEIAEHGFDYVDRQFELGYIPALIQPEGFWCWAKNRGNDVLRSMATSSDTSDIRSSALPDNRIHLLSHVR